MEPGDSLLTYAQNQSIVVDKIAPEALQLTEKTSYTAQGFLQFAEIPPRLVYLAAGDMDFGGLFAHQDIENGVHVQHQLCPVGLNRDVCCFLQFKDLFF